jgi:hypothetical protein
MWKDTNQDNTSSTIVNRNSTIANLYMGGVPANSYSPFLLHKYSISFTFLCL